MAKAKRAKKEVNQETIFQAVRLKKILKSGGNLENNDIHVRLHRAISWLKAAEETEQMDERFIFLWIAFNACYAQELGDLSKTKSSESSAFSLFVQQVLENDTEQHIYKLLWVRYSQEIRLILDNQFVFKQFWEYIQGEKTEVEFQRAFDLSNRACLRALEKGNTRYLLIELLRRLYTLRNQLFHGGATFGGTVNRTQLHDASAILMRLVPVIIEIKILNKTQGWGK
ncbi:MAG: hypothetical protein FGM54_04160, partial [Chitinophagaceae bacterium]|nr:hypothetical protein [Chitinophagaceae bacterium]